MFGPNPVILSITIMAYSVLELPFIQAPFDISKEGLPAHLSLVELRVRARK
jgi:hypothetical protein